MSVTDNLIFLRKVKHCSCGAAYCTVVGSTNKEGFWFNCVMCKSTLFISRKRYEEFGLSGGEQDASAVQV